MKSNIIVGVVLFCATPMGRVLKIGNKNDAEKSSEGTKDYRIGRQPYLVEAHQPKVP